MPRFHSGAATDRAEITKLLLRPIPKVVWQQPQEIILTGIHGPSTTETDKNTHMPKSKQRNDVESQTLSKKETSSQVSGSSTEPLLGNRTGSTAEQSLNDTKERQSEIQRHEMKITANGNRDDNISPPKKQIH